MKPQSKRDKRAQILYDELQYWGLISYESDMRAVKAIANELPQRMLVRVISKLRKMRGADGFVVPRGVAMQEGESNVFYD